jgi:hypothetical protein
MLEGAGVDELARARKGVDAVLIRGNMVMRTREGLRQVWEDDGLGNTF